MQELIRHENTNTSSDELYYAIALCMLPKIGDKISKLLIEYCGSAEAVFKEKKKALLKIPEVGSFIANIISSGQKTYDDAENEMHFISCNNIKTYYYFDTTYPHRLKNCIDSPLLLYYKGNAELNHNKIISIVGTRKATEYGKEITQQFVADLALNNTLIISGLAYGIDTCAHTAALNNGLSTVGVLAHGLDTIYPLQNKNLAERMIHQGGLLTEFCSKTKLDPGLFPRRNRIVAGLCDAVIVIEAAASGGALITAEIANSYNRDVFAIPGRITDKRSEGCNYLIKTNKAALLQNIKDLEYLLGWDTTTHKITPKQKQLFTELNNDEQTVFYFLQNKNDIASIDELSANVNLPLSKLTSSLVSMEIQGILISMPGKRYKLST